MKHWQETSLLFEEAARVAGSGGRAALATVVRILGSTYRRPGAKLLVTDDGAVSGGVSGGCLEDDVREVALGVIRGAPPVLKRYDTGGDEQQVWGLGLGCNGMVEVFVEQLDGLGAATSRVRNLLAGDRPFAAATVITGPAAGASLILEEDGTVTGSTGDPALNRTIATTALAQLGVGTSSVVEVGARQVFVEVLEPPPRLIICGAGDDARPLAATATSAGFRVTVADHRPAYLAAERFPAGVRLVQARPEDGIEAFAPSAGAFVVIQTHSLTHDRNWARSAAGSAAAYVGLLGPRERGQKLVEDLPAAARRRVFAPVGLDLGAEGPEQIAVSIVAELLAVHAGRPPRHLRERDGAIHAG